MCVCECHCAATDCLQPHGLCCVCHLRCVCSSARRFRRFWRGSRAPFTASHTWLRSSLHSAHTHAVSSRNTPVSACNSSAGDSLLFFSLLYQLKPQTPPHCFLCFCSVFQPREKRPIDALDTLSLCTHRVPHISPHTTNFVHCCEPTVTGLCCCSSSRLVPHSCLCCVLCAVCCVLPLSPSAVLSCQRQPRRHYGGL